MGRRTKEQSDKNVDKIRYGEVVDELVDQNRNSDSEDEGSDSDENASDSEEASSNEDEEEITVSKKEDTVVSNSEEEDDSSVEEEEEQAEAYHHHLKSDIVIMDPTSTATSTSSAASMTFDLRNLLALSTLPLDPSLLYNNNSNNNPKPDLSPANESWLLQQAQSGCQQLLQALWQLPVERRESGSASSAGPLAVLPVVDESRIPRALPPPPPQQETKWEKFAREKGIGQNKDKRSAKVWDEATGEWMYRHGYQKANNSDNKEWPIMEALPDDPLADPWEQKRQAKRARVDKNAAQQLLNQERAGMVAKGSAKRLLKSSNSNKNDNQNQQQQSNNNKKNKINRSEQLPVGLPVDLPASGRKGNSDIAMGATTATTSGTSQRGPTSTKAALRATQVSTASLGKFDPMRPDEPERRAAINKAANKKRKFQSATDKTVLATESERSLKLWQQLNRSGGGKTAEVARKKGRLAKGETAYDYDYSDGLGASSFKKKKGRAGAGKMKKMTKKRAK